MMARRGGFINRSDQKEFCQATSERAATRVKSRSHTCCPPRVVRPVLTICRPLDVHPGSRSKRVSVEKGSGDRKRVDPAQERAYISFRDLDDAAWPAEPANYKPGPHKGSA